MKKLFPLLLAFVMSVPCLAQQMRPGLVKDEGGYTNIRKGPGTQYEVVDQIPDGMFINFVKGKRVLLTVLWKLLTTMCMI